MDYISYNKIIFENFKFFSTTGYLNEVAMMRLTLILLWLFLIHQFFFVLFFFFNCLISQILN